MSTDYTIQHEIRNLENVNNHEELLYKILEVYMDVFPVKNAYLLRYSPLGCIGEGIILLSTTGLVHIREMRDDIRSLPIIWSAIKERTAKYVSGIDFFKQAGCKYIVSSAVNSMVVVPLCIGTAVLGYIYSTEFKEGAKIDDQMLSSFTLFGRLVGKVIETSTSPTDSTLLSNRELEVLKRISRGESTKEMADIMDISELTVKQYVKTGIKKLGTLNRAHGVAELFRKGILS